MSGLDGLGHDTAKPVDQLLDEARDALKKLAEKAAADGCPREAVLACRLLKDYGGAECVACWLEWAGIKGD